MRADNSRHIFAAARHRHEYTRAKAVQALREIDAAGTAVTFDAVARAAGVSRSWLYSQQDLRAEIEQLRATRRRSPDQSLPARQRASDESLFRRLEAATERAHQLAQENRELRRQLARALGDLRATRAAKPKHPAGSQFDND